MQKRLNKKPTKISSILESLTGKKVDERDCAIIVQALTRWIWFALVEETMITAYNGIRNTWKSIEGLNSLRTAAFVYAIKKIGNDYAALGIFP